ncbi:MAG: aminopeptidase P N-terminal domain-containing protein [Erysipelotrichaceae bacterium]|nr:aminopeptidase P N-terminal domain-containing protein [Erysipelotrichaceae bacterium]
MNYKNRREKIMEKTEDYSFLYIFSGKAPMCSADESYPFVVNRNFFYLTGIDRENMALVMAKRDGKITSTLFIEPYDEVMARWVGGRMRSEEAKEISGVDDVRDIHDLDDYFAGLYERTYRSKEPTLYFDLWRQQFDQRETDGITYANKMRERYPQIAIKDAFRLLTGSRLVKDEDEVLAVRKAIEITRRGIESMMRHIAPGQNEMLMEGAFLFSLMSNGCKETAFQTIAASGERATTLHYSDNNQVIGENELFLSDLGATYGHYCADITRTYPANGHFTDRQKELYQIVLNVQKMVKEAARPGVSIRELQQLVIDYYKEELPKHGLNKPVNEYYFHGIGHHLGLDTHDVDGGLGSVLQAGNIITDEPGLYVRDEGIGIRIEDDLLITENGAEWLSKDIIKEIDDIEAFMNR